jgi:hypothetical protein
MSKIEKDMFAMIESEINQIIEEGKDRKNINSKNAILIAEKLVGLAIENKQPESLSNDYIAIVESVCKQNS